MKASNISDEEIMKLRELKSNAIVEIYEIVAKHLNLINEAGCQAEIDVSLFDVHCVGSERPIQQVDVNVTISI